MSTTIKYKNNVLATLENESISLKTANKFVEADVEINAVGGNPDGKVYQDQYKYVVLEDDEDEDVETKIRYVKQNGLIEADSGEAFNWVNVDVNQVRNLFENELFDVTDTDLNGVETIGAYAFYGQTNLISIISKTIKKIMRNAFNNCTSLDNIYMPNVTIINTQAFWTCSVEKICFPNANLNGGDIFHNLDFLTEADFGEKLTSIPAATFADSDNLTTLILRRSSAITALANVSAFNLTPFASGKAGGTIYIPKVLYDHLGDGTSLDYKSATNWSTIDGYGTITWARIEGSQYEHYYADGRGVLQPITQNLTNCTIDNDLAHYHTEFVTQIVPDDGYTTISGVSVSMGGVDITSSAYDATSRTITIDSPDGEIVITATGGM